MRRGGALLLVFGWFAAATAFAGTNKNAGTSGAAFLKIGAGARPAAMGSAFSGLSDDVNAVAYNAAGLAFLERPELTAMHTQWLQNFNYQFGAFVYPAEWGAVAFHAATLQTDDLERRGTDESFQGTFASMDATYAVSVAKTILDGTAVGVTARYVRQELDSVTAGALVGDVGVFHRLRGRPVTFGLAVRHVGQEIEFRSESDPPPLTVDGGAAVRVLNNRLKIAVNAAQPRDNDVQFGGGGEWIQPVGTDFRLALRGGYGTAGTDAGGTTGLSFGGGLGFRRFDMDFSWVPFGDLGDTFRYSATVRF